jgi:hypothetical protein
MGAEAGGSEPPASARGPAPGRFFRYGLNLCSVAS